MARPIRETPILHGEDARRFEERMQRPRKVSKEERERVKKNYFYPLQPNDDDAHTRLFYFDLKDYKELFLSK